MAKGWIRLGAAVGLVALLVGAGRRYGLDAEVALGPFRRLVDRLGMWAIPVYVAAHTVTLSLCLPYAVFFEAGASLLFGFLPAVLCVFSAKILGASLSFWIGRCWFAKCLTTPPRHMNFGMVGERIFTIQMPLYGKAIFRSSKSATEWAQSSRYFHLLSRGVERDGWRFVLLARFSPLPSYVINYGLAATKVGFLLDFLLPTVIGCLPMILQNTSLGSLAGAAVASTTDSKKSQLYSYIFPLLGITSSILISLRIKKYSSGFTEEFKKPVSTKSANGGTDSVQVSS